jgi:glycosyltransferase involved in cell wall biosynthesis
LKLLERYTSVGPCTQDHATFLDEIKIDFRLTHPSMNFGCSSKSRTVATLGNQHQSHNSLTFFAEAHNAAARLGLARVTVIAYGFHKGFVDIFSHLGGELFSIDGQQSTSEARDQFPGVDRFACHLSSINAIESVFKRFDDQMPQMFILSGVLERLPDPRPLLKIVRRLLKKNERNRAFLANSCARMAQISSNGLPSDQSYFRQWTFEELTKFLLSCGFKIERRCFDVSEEGSSTGIFELSCSTIFYKAFFDANKLPPDNPYMIITTEHAKTKLTGGIGTYVGEVEKLLSHRPLILKIGNLGVDESVKPLVEAERWFHPDLFFSGDVRHGNDMANVALQCVEQILFYYDEIRLIEYQDYLGIGCRLAQAKAAGMIPYSIRLQAVVHGTHPSLEKAQEKWFPFSRQSEMIQEKLAIEMADNIVFSTTHMKNLYAELGYEIRPEQCIMQRLPFTFCDENPTKLDEIDTIVFFGKRSEIKGYVEFIEALQILATRPSFKRLKKIVLLGPKDPSLIEENIFFESLKSRLTVEEFDLPRQEALRTLAALAPSALCVTPYKNDAHSLTTLEAIDLNCQLLAFKAGGVPEVIPADFHEKVLCEKSSAALAYHIESAISLDEEKRLELVAGLRQACVTAQDKINRQFVVRIKELADYKEKSHPQITSNHVTVVVPCYNTELHYIKDLSFALNNQSLSPKEVIFVNDGSQQGYSESLRNCLTQELEIDFRIIDHPLNRGLSAARNTGLHSVGTKYLLTLDSDDILTNDTVLESIRYLEMSPDYAAVTHYLEYFPDGTTWEEATWNGSTYEPLGQGFVLGQFENILGSALAAFRVKDLKEVGGWDANDKSMFEDWALYLKIIAKGMKIGVIPKTGYLCRERPNSMLRTYNRFHGQVRLARNSVDGFSLFEAYRLQGALQTIGKTHEELRSTLEELHRTREELQRPAYKAARLCATALEKFPRFKKMLTKVARGGWRMARKARDLRRKIVPLR